LATLLWLISNNNHKAKIEENFKVLFSVIEGNLNILLNIIMASVDHKDVDEKRGKFYFEYLTSFL
jgi:hypothetical protein